MARTDARVTSRQGYTRQLALQADRLLPGVKVPLAVALTSVALIISEIGLTRLFSVVLAYYFVYLLLSVAILGLGLGALIAHWQGKRFRNRSSLARVLLGAGGSVLLLTCFFVVTASRDWWLLYLLFGCAPFVLVGIFFSRVFSDNVEQSGSLYWADLSGASLGVLVVLWVLTSSGAINALLLAAFIFALSGLVYWPASRLVRIGTALLGLLVFLNLSANLIELDLSRADSSKTIVKALGPAGLDGEVIFSDWDAFARTDIVAYPELPDERTIFVDGGSGSTVFRMEDGLEDLAFLRNDLGYLPFRLTDPRSVFIIGPGGGKDIALSLLAGSRTITAVEINPGVVRALDFLSEYNGNLHRHPAVDLHVAEGRSYLEADQRTYDLIYLSLVANEAADIAGLALSENYIYTQEAFLDYLAHLAPEGAVALRLHGEPHLQRAFITALSALASTGLSTSEAIQQIVMVSAPHPRSPAEIDPLLLVFASPLSPLQANSVREATEGVGATPLFIPYAHEVLPYAAFSQGKIPIQEFLGRLSKDSYARPTTDDRPFFYLLEGALPHELIELSILLVVAIVGWLIYTYFRSGRLRPKQTSSKEVWLYWGYFAVIGAGFMLIEVSLLQRFSLFLGHPVRSLAVVLAGLLLATGVGSLITQRQNGLSVVRLVGWSALGVVALSILYLVLLPILIPTLHGSALAWRVIMTIGLIFPLGLLMGIPFPSGLRLLATRFSADGVALAWATNGLFSVGGTVLAMVIAIRYGFSFVWTAGLIGYLILAALVWGGLRRAT